MNRPSHWLLAFFLVVGGVLWGTGDLQRALERRPAPGDPGTSQRPEPVVVRRGNRPALPPTNSVLVGAVVDRLGWPVVGAEVSVVGVSPAGADRAEPVRTDTEGRFEIAVSGAANKTLRVVARGRHRPELVRGSLDPLLVVMQDAVPWEQAGRPRRPAPSAVSVDSGSQGRSAQGQSAQGRSAQGQSAQGRSAQGQSAQGRSAQGRSAQGQSAQGRGIQGPGTPRPEFDSLLIGEGFVKDGTGRHVVGARVVVRESGASVRTDANGRYAIPLPAVASTLLVWDDDGQVAVSEPMTHVRRQGKVPLPDLVVREGLALRGRLVDEEGEPTGGAAIFLDNGGVTRRSRSGAAGEFAFRGLVADDSELTVPPCRGHLAFRKEIALQADVDLGDVTFERALPRPLWLRVVDEEHRPMPHVHVVAEQNGLRRAYGQANQAGEVGLGGLGRGSIAFEVREQDFEPLGVVAYDSVERELIVTP